MKDKVISKALEYLKSSDPTSTQNLEQLWIQCKKQIGFSDEPPSAPSLSSSISTAQPSGASGPEQAKASVSEPEYTTDDKEDYIEEDSENTDEDSVSSSSISSDDEEDDEEERALKKRKKSENNPKRKSVTPSPIPNKKPKK